MTMKNNVLKLEDYGIVELNQKQAKEIEGGWVWSLFRWTVGVGVGGGLAYTVYSCA